MIVGHVIRERHAKDLHHVLKYADLEACAQAPDVRKSFLYLNYPAEPITTRPKWRRKGRASEDWYELLTLHYHPEAGRVLADDGTPWAGVDEPVVVFSQVPPVPRDISAWLPKLRSFVAGVVAEKVEALAPRGLPTGRWIVHVALLPESSTLEVGVQTWTDLRHNDEIVERIPVP